MTRDDVVNEYFNWLYDVVCEDRYSKEISYRKLLMYLHHVEFVWSIPMDANRADDGVKLRRRFALRHDELDYNYILDCLDNPCSVLEMMIALALRCEETIMDDPQMGNRKSQWFWGMVVSLGLGSMTDDIFDKRIAEDIVDIFLNREYEPNGKGGLFTVRNSDRDLRNMQIWFQMLRFLNTINH